MVVLHFQTFFFFFVFLVVLFTFMNIAFPPQRQNDEIGLWYDGAYVKGTDRLESERDHNVTNW